jgi:hypothetical protein
MNHTRVEQNSLQADTLLTRKRNTRQSFEETNNKQLRKLKKYQILRSTPEYVDGWWDGRGSSKLQNSLQNLGITKLKRITTYSGVLRVLRSPSRTVFESRSTRLVFFLILNGSSHFAAHQCHDPWSVWNLELFFASCLAPLSFVHRWSLFALRCYPGILLVVTNTLLRYSLGVECTT